MFHRLNCIWMLMFDCFFVLWGLQLFLLNFHLVVFRLLKFPDVLLLRDYTETFPIDLSLKSSYLFVKWKNVRNTRHSCVLIHQICVLYLLLKSSDKGKLLDRSKLLSTNLYVYICCLTAFECSVLALKMSVVILQPILGVAKSNRSFDIHLLILTVKVFAFPEMWLAVVL